MGVDVAGDARRGARLQRVDGGPAARSGRRPTWPPASARHSPRIDNMALRRRRWPRRGFVPKDVAGAAGAARQDRQGACSPGASRRRGAAAGTARRRRRGRFYPGCALPQDREAHAPDPHVARGLGLPLAEAGEARCCGHPTRGPRGEATPATEPCSRPARPATQGLRDGRLRRPCRSGGARGAGRRDERPVAARGAARFVPYVGCLTDRGPALTLAQRGGRARRRRASTDAIRRCTPAAAAPWAASTAGATEAVRRADRLRRRATGPHRHSVPALPRQRPLGGSQARGNIQVHFWPEFFQAAGPAERPGRPR